MDQERREKTRARRLGEPPQPPGPIQTGDRSSEAWLDEALEETFPASDPIAPFHRTARGGESSGPDRDDRQD